MALVRRQGGSAGGGCAGPASDPETAKVAPTLVEWLTTEVWEGGDKRRTGTVMVLAEDGVFKAWLHDRDGSCSCWVSAGTLLDLLEAVEGLLASGAGNWRKDQAPRKK